MDLPLDVTFNVTRFSDALKALPRWLDCRQQPMRDAMAKASAEHMRWQRGRFVSASGGDGTWKPLSAHTKRTRAEAQAKGTTTKQKLSLAVAAGLSMPLEFVTGTLEAALFEQGANGHYQKFTKDGVTEGVAGGSHPTAPITVGQLATLQHYGDPSRNLPGRPLYGEPDAQVVQAVGQLIAGGVQAAFDHLAATVSGPLHAEAA